MGSSNNGQSFIERLRQLQNPEHTSEAIAHINKEEFRKLLTELRLAIANEKISDGHKTLRLLVEQNAGKYGLRESESVVYLICEIESDQRKRAAKHCQVALPLSRRRTAWRRIDDCQLEH